MPQKRRTRHHKRELMKGGMSFSEIANALYSGVKSVHKTLLKYKPASTILKYIPAAANIPYAGKALTLSKEYLGYGHRKRKAK